MADDAIATFVGITGADEATARFHLEASGFQLEQAIEMFFSGDQQGPGGGALGAPPPFVDDEALARQLQSEAEARPAEEEVRAPIPVRTERLYGDMPHRPPLPTRRVDPVPHNVVDAFREFGPEGEGGSGQRLASMFEPPRELLFVGSFEEAKQKALEKQCWLLANVQSTNQFASHQLNRDTWRNDMVRSLVENNFVFFQVYDVVEEGQKLMSNYRLYELPATLVVDPVTGAPMRQWGGFVNAERMTEELMPFLDHSIHDPAASRLAAGMKRKKSGRDIARQSSQPLTEEEELQRALAMSLQQVPGGGAAGAAGASGSSGAGEGMALSDEEDERAVMEALRAQQQQQQQEQPEAAAAPAVSPEAAAAEAAARLPPEPEGAEGCRIAVRFPDGRRGQRRFPRSAPLAAVRDYCLSQVPEAAGGRQFTLSLGFPGAPALSDLQQSLEGAQVADAMLVMKWMD